MIVIKNYLNFKKKNINLKLFNKIFDLYRGWLNKYSLINLKFSYIITKHVSSVFTILKSPMAQKKFSKEQLGFRYYNINFSVKLDSNIFLNNSINFNNVDNLLYFFIFLKIKFYEIFNGLFMFHGINIIIKINYFFKPLWNLKLN